VRRDLPQRLVQHNRADPAWLAGLEALVARLARRWSLDVGDCVPGAEINFVAPATRADGRRCFLKLSRHVRETRTEMAALRLWDGHGAARLLDAEPELGALLIERIEPGSMLIELAEADDEAATLVAADMLGQLWRPPPADHGLRPLADWCAAYDRNRQALASGPFAALFNRADALRAELLASTEQVDVLHGDLHHYNVLRDERVGGRAIDPKGLVGDPHFDVCQFLRNPLPGPSDVAISRRRLDIFAAERGLERPRAVAWCLVHAVLDACWEFEAGRDWRPALAWAEQTREF
jgi:streptomycin 6-kinase